MSLWAVKIIPGVPIRPPDRAPGEKKKKPINKKGIKKKKRKMR